jgi:hypothetical protein
MAQNQEDQTIVIPMPQGGGVPIPQRNDRAELIDKINPEAVIQVTRHMLLGEEWNGSTWIKVKALENDSLTELGAWKIAAQLQGIANISTSISKYKEELIKSRLKRIAQNTQIQLVGNFNYVFTTQPAIDHGQLVFMIGNESDTATKERSSHTWQPVHRRRIVSCKPAGVSIVDQ